MLEVACICVSVCLGISMNRKLKGASIYSNNMLNKNQHPNNSLCLCACLLHTTQSTIITP